MTLPVFRVATVGTSITNAGYRPGGWMVGSAQWPGCADLARLEVTDRTLEFLNFGIGGAAISTLYNARSAPIASAPHLVMLDSVTNDTARSKGLTVWEQETLLIQYAEAVKAALPQARVGLWTMCPILPHALRRRGANVTDPRPYWDRYRMLALSRADLFDLFIDGQVAWERLRKPDVDSRLSWMETDGIHPKADGMLKFWVPFVGPALGRAIAAMPLPAAPQA